MSGTDEDMKSKVKHHRVLAGATILKIEAYEKDHEVDQESGGREEENEQHEMSVILASLLETLRTLLVLDEPMDAEIDMKGFGYISRDLSARINTYRPALYTPGMLRMSGKAWSEFHCLTWRRVQR
jgi:hypothetical protein